MESIIYLWEAYHILWLAIIALVAMGCIYDRLYPRGYDRQLREWRRPLLWRLRAWLRRWLGDWQDNLYRGGWR